MSGRHPITRENANSCTCRAATSAGIVRSGESWQHQDRLYHKRGPMPYYPWRHKDCISMSPLRRSEMNPCIRSQSNDRRRIITDVGIFARAVAFQIGLQLPFSAFALSWKRIYIGGIGMMIHIHVTQQCLERTAEVMQVIGCVLEWEAWLSAGHVILR